MTLATPLAPLGVNGFAVRRPPLAFVRLGKTVLASSLSCPAGNGPGAGGAPPVPGLSEMRSDHVVSGQRMSSRAMGLCCVPFSKGVAAPTLGGSVPRVFKVVTEKQVSRIAAERRVTLMKYIQAVGNWTPTGENPSDPMDTYAGPALKVGTSISADPLVLAAQPEPASRLFVEPCSGSEISQRCALSHKERYRSRHGLSIELSIAVK